ncbi:hypothetical protein KUTeg_005383 [Tegillarca granosa]|uniref:Uncharacterized protein n=1 Tax=Tegillarca granosa TaxID=220873 RepID=A0ABQ9FJN6_TEGGR|nr:hypothetical protein KUTeg_005383 [Tegillarca granosa]
MKIRRKLGKPRVIKIVAILLFIVVIKYICVYFFFVAQRTQTALTTSQKHRYKYFKVTKKII